MAMILFFCYILLHYSHTGNNCMYFSPAKTSMYYNLHAPQMLLWHPLNLFKVFVNAIV